MTKFEQLFVAFYAFVSLIFFIAGYYQSKFKKNAYGSFSPMNIIGAFVWGDSVIFGLFWTAVSSIVLYLDSWILFLLFLSVFWFMRSIGEMIYWLNQQFSEIKRNQPERLTFLYSIFQNDSVWFVYQIYWQCIGVVSLIASIYFAHSWLNSI